MRAREADNCEHTHFNYRSFLLPNSLPQEMYFNVLLCAGFRAVEGEVNADVAVLHSDQWRAVSTRDCKYDQLNGLFHMR